MLKSLVFKAWKQLLFAGLMSMLSGALSVGIIATINESIATISQGQNQQLKYIAVHFFALAFMAMVTNSIAIITLESLSQRVHANLRHMIADKVNESDYATVEFLGVSRIQSVLSEHTLNIKYFFGWIPHILSSLVIIVGCLIYMANLSIKVFLLAILIIAVGFAVQYVFVPKAKRHIKKANAEQDHMVSLFNSLILGAKELRLNALKRQVFRKKLLHNSIDNIRKERTVGINILLLASVWNSFLIYIFLGLVLFVFLGGSSAEVKIMTGFALLLVYMIGPVQVVLEALPPMQSSAASAKHIEQILNELPQTESLTEQVQLKFHRVELLGATHKYFHEGNNELFTLGPVDLSFKPGEIVFLVGGNGSGKTTLAKLILGLYKPEQGSVNLDGRVVTDTNRDDYRQLFTAVFPDYHLFESLLDGVSKEFDEKGNALIAKLNLQHKVEIKEGAFTTRSLSQGQRKRLALVVAYLEDRPFLVFDEWAADQDPVFKDVFYNELLPELKAQGKTLLVISHDDRYFHLADRLIKMENGQIVP